MPRYCRNCILPETRPGVRLNESGVCFGCRSVQAKAEIDWEERKKLFSRIRVVIIIRTQQPISGFQVSDFWCKALGMEY